MKAAVASYWPERVERLTGIPEEMLMQTARILGNAQSLMILAGRGPPFDTWTYSSALEVPGIVALMKLQNGEFLVALVEREEEARGLRLARIANTMIVPVGSGGLSATVVFEATATVKTKAPSTERGMAHPEVPASERSPGDPTTRCGSSYGEYPARFREVGLFVHAVEGTTAW